MSYVSLWIETRLVDNLGTCKTFFKTREGCILISPLPATMVNDPSTNAIFLLLGHGL